MANQLSPAAQAVYDAVLATYHESVPRDDSLWALERASTVAALRAAVEQVLPEKDAARSPCREHCVIGSAAEHIRHEFLAIATELENHQ